MTYDELLTFTKETIAAATIPKHIGIWVHMEKHDFIVELRNKEYDTLYWRKRSCEPNFQSELRRKLENCH
jgi:hypothetical protein